MIDPEHVQTWLDDYRMAWETYDPERIGALFTDDAEYRWHPWDDGDDVVRGRAAIVEAWQDEPDAPGTFDLRMRPLVVKDDLAIAVGTCHYYTDATRSALDSQFHNLWELRFADDGRCSAFTEWFMQPPADE